jgi:hypothetical protein
MVRVFACLALLISVNAYEVFAPGNGTRILIMGDSWGSLSPGTEHFEKELKEHKCSLGGFNNIAIGGTTASQWAARSKMAEVKKSAADHDLVSRLRVVGRDTFTDFE